MLSPKLFLNSFLTAILLVVVICLSCTPRNLVHIVLPNGNVYSRNGMVRDYSIDMSKKKVVNYFTIGGLIMNLEYTDTGKIDNIIRNNSDWEFIFYIKCTPKDTAKVENILSRYKCDFPVILDFNDEFAKQNFSDQYGGIGYICDEKNRSLSLALIGTRQSFFDQNFARVKSQLK